MELNTSVYIPNFVLVNNIISVEKNYRDAGLTDNEIEKIENDLLKNFDRLFGETNER